MPSGLLTLRKLQLRSLRERIVNLPSRTAIRVLTHEILRLHEAVYKTETYDEQLRFGIITPKTQSETCTRCGLSPQGFRTKEGTAVWHVLGLCQRCQDLNHQKDHS